jgi:hypothetical protein
MKIFFLLMADLKKNDINGWMFGGGALPYRNIYSRLIGDRISLW